jgi:four helix bundle protein
MRDHRKLKVFRLADELVIAVYRTTCGFPRHELFGLVSQIRRCALSTAANIVEGCGRKTERDFNRFLDISFGSIRELGYLIDVSIRLGYLADTDAEHVQGLHTQLAAAMTAFIRRREVMVNSGRTARSRPSRSRSSSAP